MAQEINGKIMFWAKTESLQIVVEADCTKHEFRAQLADALFAIVAADRIDAIMKWIPSDGSQAHVDITLRAPHHQAFSALNDVTGVLHDTDGFIALQLPPNLSVWLLLDVLAATVSEMYALSIRSKGLQRLCDAISVRNPSLPILWCEQINIQ